MLRQTACIVLLVTMCRAAHAQATVWELTPYRINVLVAAPTSGDLPPAIEQEIATHIADRAAAVVGGSWKLIAASAAGELRTAMLGDLTQIEAAQLAAAAKDVDKVILLAIIPAKNAVGYLIEAREWDALTKLWNAPVAVQVAQPELVPQAAFRAVLAAFAPLARIETVDGDQATLRMRAGAIPLRDRQLTRIQPGAVFRPVIVDAERVQPIDWTFLTPIDPAAATLRCRVQTGASGEPLPAYHPLRQRLALGVSPSSRGTKLKLVSRGEGAEPLEGYEVLAEDAPAAKSLGRSDRAGQLTVAPADSALRQLLVRHGEQTLLRLPLVPGLESETTLALPDVRGAVTLDAALAELEDNLIDLIAQREVLQSRLKLAGGDAAAKAKLQDRLSKLPKTDAFATRLQQHEQAAKSGEPLAQARLLAKVADLRKLLDTMNGNGPMTSDK